jgi:hypothetical protein
MQSGRKASSPVCSWMVLLGWVFLVTGLSAAEVPGPAPAAGAGGCKIDIQGSHIRRLTLEAQSGYVRPIDHPGPRISLPPGKYRVRQVDLEGGYQFYGFSAADPGWFTLTPETPYQLKVGGPLTPSVKVTRWGRFLTLDYQLLDAGGRAYRGGASVNRPRSISRPRFTVYRGEREIGSDSFAYG